MSSYSASPGKDRSAAEKEEMAKKYKPGEQVLPTINTHRTAEEQRADAEDRSSDQLHVEGERRRRRSESRQRQIEHQSSIRSLISSGDMSERDIEREIESFARQIQEEGLLDGLDLDNIDLSRDDELSRRITEAYRRRQRDRTRQEARRNNGNTYPPLTRHAENAAADPRMLAPEGGRARERSRPHSRSASAASATSAASQTEERTRPPTSTISASLEVQEPVRRPRRRTASGGRSSTTPVFPTTAEPRPAARSSTDLGSRPQASDASQSRPSFSEGRSTSTPVHTVPFPNPTEAAAFSNNAGNMSFASRQGTFQSASVPPLFSHHDSATSAAGRSNRPRPVDLAIVHQTVTSPISSPTVSGHQRTRSQLYPEPSVSCSRCNKQHIEYELHYNCSISPENGHSGWRRCLNGHRMVVIAFTDGKSGRWRYVAQDLVGGQGLKLEAAEKAEHREKGLQKWVWLENGQDLARLVTKDVSETAPTESGFTKTLPPDGGVGMKATARFGWYPRSGADDELLFPKGAEIKEIEDVNGEWFFGAYMGSRGLFPAPYVRLEQNN
ncbi:hypothetical protein IL306_011257 [Fusarium sp. DS 682]|nr:hypothetical protein IL306_011257 [Fusarium sp. DS 682]